MENVILIKPVVEYMRREVPQLLNSLTVEEALRAVRGMPLTDQIVYFYIVDDKQKLLGVLPIRRLLNTENNLPIDQLMIRHVITIAHDDTMENACRLLNEHKFLALPVVDNEGILLGIIEVTIFTKAGIDFNDRHRFDDIFETIGLRYSLIKFSTPFSAYVQRVPWLMPNMFSGLICALLVGYFEYTLRGSIIIAFFLPLVLGMGESVSIQSLTIAVRKLSGREPKLAWYIKTLRKELQTVALIGLSTGSVTGLLAFCWKGNLVSAIAVGVSLLFTLIVAGVIGITIPAIIHHFSKDPKIAAGPIVLAVTDICTLLILFTTATFFLGV